MDVVVWLRSLGLEEYEVAFRDNKIDERVLPSLTAEDLKEIGVGPVGHRRTLLTGRRRYASGRRLAGRIGPQSGDSFEECSAVTNWTDANFLQVLRREAN
jgi:hypothetical protein